MYDVGRASGLYDRVQKTRLSFPISSPVILSFILLFAISQQHTQLEGVFAYISVSSIYVIFFMTLLFHTSINLRAERLYILLFTMFLSFIAISTIANPTAGSVIRLGAVAIFTAANLFVIPSVLSFDQFIVSCSRFSAIIAAIGFLPYLGISTIGPADISLWGASIYWNPNLNPITSIYVNPNALGFLLFIGSVAALIEWGIYNNKSSKFILIITVVGLMFTNYRTGWIAFIIVLGLFIIYFTFGQKGIVVSVIGGLVSALALISLTFNLTYGPEYFVNHPIGGRRIRWLSAVEAFQQNTLTGYGFGNVPGNPHNSFLRMFVALGVGGGTIYLLFYLITVIKSVQRANSYRLVGIAALLAAFFAVQFMNNLSFVGISLHSTFISIVMGYHITGINTDTS